jgi:hypothetical protein
VNKVSTKVDMRLKLAAADWLQEEIRDAVTRMVSAPPHPQPPTTHPPRVGRHSGCVQVQV